MADYDAFVLVSFGGPEGPADVMPFLENVTRGRAVPRERLAEVAHHYDRFGGGSPSHQQWPDPPAAHRENLPARGPGLPLYRGDRSRPPYPGESLCGRGPGRV